MPRSSSENNLLREAAQARILEGSIAVFARKGYHAASMEDVAASAGVSKGLPYFYFKSKEELFVRALGERVGHLFRTAMELDANAAPGERLAALVTALVANVRREPEVFRLYLSLSLERSLSKAAARTLRELGEPLEAYLAAARRIFEELGSPDPDLDALIFRSALLGIFLRFSRAMEEIPLEALCDRLVDLFRSEDGAR